jgi:hypothetical protein
VSYRFEWFHGLVLLGVVLVLLIVPPFALIALAAVALAAGVAFAALPYLLVRSLRRQRAARRRSTDENPVPMASVVARTGSAAPQSGVAARARTTTARGST